MTGRSAWLSRAASWLIAPESPARLEPANAGSGSGLAGLKPGVRGGAPGDLGQEPVGAALLSRAASWLIAPAAEAGLDPAPAPTTGVTNPVPASLASIQRPVVAVCGLTPGAGATTIARALAAALAARDPLRSALVVGPDGRGALPLGTASAARLARIVSERTGLATRVSGRLCLALDGDPRALATTLRDTAPVVLDVGGRAAADALVPIADRVVLVATARSEPALVEIVAAALTADRERPIVVVNRIDGLALDGEQAHAQSPAAGGVRAADTVAVAGAAAAAERASAAAAPAGSTEPRDRWAGRADIAVPASAAAAFLALSGRGAGGRFGTAVEALAERCLER